MKARKYTEEQMISVLKEGEAGAKVGEVSRRLGITEQTYYRCRKEYNEFRTYSTKAYQSPAPLAIQPAPDPGTLTFYMVSLFRDRSYAIIYQPREKRFIERKGK